MNMLLDLGNTRLKWACHDGDRLSGADAISWESFEREGVPDAWGPLVREARQVWAVSVAGAGRETLLADALRAHGVGRVHWVRTSPAAACGVRNAYRAPEKLGIDRFLAMVAAREAGLAPCVVVSAGTALTLDALAADGRHLGGLIAPGARLMQRALHDAAARLPEPVDAPMVDAANDTESAIASGCRQAALALIERFHARMAGRLGGTATVVVLSGGDAQSLAADLDVPVQVRAEQVLQGLAVWAHSMPSGT